MVVVVRWLHAQHVAGIFQRWAALRLLPATATRGLLLLIPTAKLRAALHHAQELVELNAEIPNSSAMTYRTSRSLGCSEPSAKAAWI
jgi:hypothetical protein